MPTIQMNDSCPDEHLSSAASIVLSLWFSLPGFATVAGNAVVLWLFYRNESLRTTSNGFLTSLSVTDFLVGLVIDPVLGLRQSLLLHQRSTHWFTISEITNFAEPFTAPSVGYPLFTDKIHQTLTLAQNLSEAKGFEKLELLSALQVRRQSFEENSSKNLKHSCLIIRLAPFIPRPVRI